MKLARHLIKGVPFQVLKSLNKFYCFMQIFILCFENNAFRRCILVSKPAFLSITYCSECILKCNLPKKKKFVMSTIVTPKCVSFNVIQGLTKTNALISDRKKIVSGLIALSIKAKTALKTKNTLRLLFLVNLAMTQSLDSCSFFRKLRQYSMHSKQESKKFY